MGSDFGHSASPADRSKQSWMSNFFKFFKISQWFPKHVEIIGLEERTPFNANGIERNSESSATNDVNKINLQTGIERAVDAILLKQKPDGHWSYPFEIPVFTTAYHVHYLGYVGEMYESKKSEKVALYLRRRQNSDGGWSNFPGGPFNINYSVATYFALKLLGDKETEEHMISARSAIIKHGGVEACSYICRFQLALYGLVPWSSVPTIPVEIILLPFWLPFHIYRLNSWARALIIPMAILQAIGRPAKNPQEVTLDEIFIGKPSEIKPLGRAKYQKWSWFIFFRVFDFLMSWLVKILPQRIRKSAISSGVKYVSERLNGASSLGCYSLSIEFSLMMFDALGYPPDHNLLVTARDTLYNLIQVDNDEAYMYTIESPGWDTCLAMHALLESGDSRALAAAKKSLKWIRPRQFLNIRGGWAIGRPNLRPGGFGFFYKAPHNPDIDDTTTTLLAVHRLSTEMKGLKVSELLSRGIEWVIGMQNNNGGWSAFEDPSPSYLSQHQFAFDDQNEVPTVFMDETSIDLTATCLASLIQVGSLPLNSKICQKALHFILERQEKNGSWYGRWGVNYIYGTRAALTALNAAGIPHNHLIIVRAVSWLISIQNKDGGWGEDPRSYMAANSRYVNAESTASQTAWALLGLMSAGAVGHQAVTSGIKYLLSVQNIHGVWDEDQCTGTGHPNFDYIRYEGYSKYFPLLAIARFQNLITENKRTVEFGY